MNRNAGRKIDVDFSAYGMNGDRQQSSMDLLYVYAVHKQAAFRCAEASRDLSSTQVWEALM